MNSVTTGPRKPRILTALATLIAASTLVFTGVYPASASTESESVDWYEHYGVTEEEAQQWEQDVPEALTPELIDEARVNLAAAGHEYTVKNTDGVEHWEFNLPGGFDLSLPVDAAPATGDEMSPMIGGGVSGSGFYVTFNSVDQRALASGASAALGVAICAIPGFGIPACIVSSFVIGAGIVYVNSYGVCSNNGTLRIDSNYAGTITGTRCV